MKKILQAIMLLIMGSSFGFVQAQIADNTPIPNFTATDITGNTHTLYNYLDQGYTVFIDFSATWCGPCWSLHSSHAMEDLFAKHGPAGMAGVLANTTNDVMVFFVESDASTNTDCLYNTTGCNSSTQGDWVTGTPYPIIDDATIKTPYQICGYPNVFVICPNRLVRTNYCGYSTAMTEPNLYTKVGTCPQLFNGSDAALVSYIGTTATCGDVNLKVRLQNMGTTPLTSCTIVTKNGNDIINTYNWSGNLSTYAIQDVTLGVVSITQNAILSIEITTTDGNASNNKLTQNVIKALQGDNVVTVSVSTDRYGSETKWTLKNSSGQTVLSGGPYTNASASGSYPQPDKVATLPLGCYTFTITDDYGDGICCDYGDGSYVVKDGTGMIYAQGGQFTDKESKPLEVKTITAVNGVDALVNMAGVFPNPASENFTVYFDLINNSEVHYTVTNVLGQQLVNLDLGQINKGTHTYSITTENFASGLYFITLNVNNESKVFKLYIEK